MGILLAATGIALLLYALVETFWTVFLDGGAPLTSRLCHYEASVLLWVHCRLEIDRVRSKAGLVTVVTTLLVWAVLIWAGWSLVFCSAPGALVDTATGHPADVFSRIYFAGYTIFTLGLGDYKPVGPLWQFLTVIASGTGFFLFGLALAYLVPVVQADVQKRQTAITCWCLGHDPADMLVRAWNGVDSSALAPHLISLIPMLAQLGENHLTYPVLHYFHSNKRSAALAPNVATLDEALTILECGLQSGCSLDLPSLGAAREAITEFLNTLQPALILPADEAPPVPSLRALRDVGVPAVDEELFASALAGLSSRRKLLLALVRNEGWDWDAVWPTENAVRAVSPPSVVTAKS